MAEDPIAELPSLLKQAILEKVAAMPIERRIADIRSCVAEAAAIVRAEVEERCA